jgi:hypothetical protein
LKRGIENTEIPKGEGGARLIIMILGGNFSSCAVVIINVYRREEVEGLGEYKMIKCSVG